MTDSDLQEPPGIGIYLTGLWLLAALYAFSGVFSLYKLVVLFAVEGQDLSLLPSIVLGWFAVMLCNALLSLTTAWFMVKRHRYAIGTSWIMLALWLGILLLMWMSFGRPTRFQPGVGLFFMTGLVISGGSMAYLYFLRFKKILH
ncbi:hypothetical protein DZC30_10045 [Comamonas testosteroni]|uniref:Transmembrane protein n=1 Tax=Comamonas testosteroni TaxID=285 RepID=A0A373FMA7_COMTE|nr:hypothetical protein [Comamonas testosteroni]RGE45286.1 hypothetical protein DZC30_10045 [Comamonas testosteroni]